MCEFPACRNATAGDAPMCSSHTTVRISTAWPPHEGTRKQRNRYDDEES